MGERLRRAVGALGAVATLLGLVAVVRPAAVTATEPFATLVAAASDVRARDLLLVGGALVGLSLLRSVRTDAGRRVLAGETAAAEQFERALEDPPETATADRWALTGADLDAAIRRGAEGDDPAFERVRERLAAVATRRLSRRDDYTVQSAERAVRTGSWTDDPTAAALLSGPEGPVHSRRSRLRRWLDPSTERRRRLRRTVAALEALDPVAESSDGRPPDPETERQTRGGDGR